MLLQGRVRDLPFCDTELLNLTGFTARTILRGEEDENSEGRGLEICAIAEEEEEEAAAEEEEATAMDAMAMKMDQKLFSSSFSVLPVLSFLSLSLFCVSVFFPALFTSSFFFFSQVF